MEKVKNTKMVRQYERLKMDLIEENRDKKHKIKIYFCAYKLQICIVYIVLALLLFTGNAKIG